MRTPVISIVVYVIAIFAVLLYGQDCNDEPNLTKAETIGVHDIHLEWKIDAPDPMCNSTLKYFEIINYRSTNRDDRVTKRVDADQRNRVIQVETPCTTQTCYIEAHYLDDFIAKSNEVNVTLQEIPVIEGLKSKAISSGTLLLTWSPVPTTCNLLHYNVKYKLTYQDQCQIVEGEEILRTSSNASIELNDLQPYSTYDVQVESVAGTLSQIDVANIFAQTGQDAPSKPPDKLSAHNETRKHLLFQWDEPPCGDRNGPITRYKYSLRSLNDDELIEEEYTSSTTIEIHNGLEDYAEYNFNISAETEVGTGPDATLIVRTEEGVASAPTGVEVHKHFNRIDIKWDPLQNVPGQISAYYIYHKTDDDLHETYTRLAGSNITEFKLEALKGRTKYKVKVCAETGGGIGEWSDEKEVTTEITIASVVVLGVIIASLLIVVIAIIMVFIYKRRTAPLPLTILDGPGRYNPYGIGVPGEIAWNKLSLGNEIGEGRFGKTYLTMLVMGEGDDKHQVVCKQLTFKVDADKEEICRQVSRLCQVTRHAHVLTTMGFCQRKNSLYMLKVHVNKGHLYAYIHRDRPYGIPELFKLRVSVAVAHGMQHLASHMVVHGDLCLKKILLNDNGREWEPKISGYGLSECWNELQISEDSSSSSDTNTWPVHQYPPEKIERNIYDTKGDVWAFGVLLWEFFTETPVPSILKTGRIMKCPVTMDERLYNIMKHCWLTDPRKRPQFFDLADALTAFLTADNDDEHPYDILKPQEHRRSSLTNRRSSAGKSQPRVSISTTDLPRSSITSRRIPSSIPGDVYYRSSSRDEDLMMMHPEDGREDVGIEGPGSRNLSEEVDENTYSSRMNSIIPGHHLSIPTVQTIEEEDEDEEEEEEEGEEGEEQEEEKGEDVEDDEDTKV